MKVWAVCQVEMFDDRPAIVEFFGVFSSEHLARQEAARHEGDVFVGPVTMDEPIPETVEWPEAYFVGWSE